MYAISSRQVLLYLAYLLHKEAEIAADWLRK